MNPDILFVNDVACSRNQRALFANVTFSLSAGDVMHLRGENGIGKTTLLRCLATFSRPTQGVISWCGKSIFEVDDYSRKIFYLGHRNTLKSSLTLKENILYSPSTYYRPVCEEIAEVLKTMGLELSLDCLAGHLSSGQRQRLALAKLLFSRTKIWILDEPFNFLDKKGIDMTREILQEHLRKGGIIIFTSHHDIDFTDNRLFTYDLIPI